MEITRVNVTRIKPFHGLIAFAEVVLDDQLLLGSIGIHEKRDGMGYRLTYPSKMSGKRSISVHHPIHMALSRRIEEAVFAKLKTVMGKAYVGHGSADAKQS